MHQQIDYGDIEPGSPAAPDGSFLVCHRYADGGWCFFPNTSPLQLAVSSLPRGLCGEWGPGVTLPCHTLPVPSPAVSGHGSRRQHSGHGRGHGHPGISSVCSRGCRGSSPGSRVCTVLLHPGMLTATVTALLVMET